MWFTTAEGQAFLEQKLADDLEKDLCEVDIPEIPSSAIFDKITSKIEKKRPYKKLLRVAAVVIPLFAVGTLWFSYPNMAEKEAETEWVEAYIPRGEKRQLLLQDGSSVWLNANSTIQYPKSFNKELRYVKLKGEGLFEIAKNPDCPFIVEIDDIQIRVLGTTFNARSYETDDEVRVVLKEGLIQVVEEHQNDQKHMVHPGEMMVYSKQSGNIQVDKLKGKDISGGWVSDKFVFQNTSLSEVLFVLGNRYDKEFIVADSSVLKYTYTISFHETELNTMLKNMSRITPVTFKKHDEETYVVSST